MRTITLHGSLGKQFAKTVELDCANMFQVMGALISRFGPAFQEAIRVGRWHVTDGAVKAGNDLDEKELGRTLKKAELHIVPIVEGASSTLRIIIGAVLIALSFVPGFQWVLPYGAALVIGGVVEMLSKPPSMNQSDKLDQGGSSLFNGAKNVTTQGGPIPLVFGRVRRASSVVISTDFSSTRRYTPSEDTTYYPSEPGTYIP